MGFLGCVSSPRSVRVMAAAAAGVFAALVLTTAVSRAQSVYVEGQILTGNTGAGGTSQGQLGILDLASGRYSTVGTHSVTLTGLALAGNGTLYGAGNSVTGQGILYRVNRTTAALTQLNTFNLGGTLAGITFGSDGQLYGLVAASSGTASLARFSSLATTPTAAVSTLSPSFVGNGGLTADGSGNLYASQGDIPPDGGGSIYRVTPAGNTTALLGQDPGFQGATVFALTFAGGQIYGFDNGGFGPGGAAPGGIYQISPADGSGSQIAAYNTGVVGSISAASNVIAPEPGTLALALTGASILGIARRRRK